MLKQITKIYDGSDLSGAASGVCYIPITYPGNVMEVVVQTDQAVTGANAVFSVSKNGVVDTDYGMIMIPGSKAIAANNFSKPVVRGDEFILNLVSGSVSSPVSFTLLIDEAVTFDDLSDVVITAPSAGQVPTWNGVSWVNAAPITTEALQDLIAAMFISGSNTSWVYDDAAGTLKVDSVQLTDEQVQDKVGAFLSSGANTTVTYNDGANTLTIAETTAGKTQEEIEDIVAALLSQGSNVTLTYNDAGNVLTIAASSGGGGGDAASIRTKTVENLAALTVIGDDFEAAGFNLDKRWQVIGLTAPTTAIASTAAPYTNISQSGGLLSNSYTSGGEFFIRSKRVAKFVDGSYVIFRGLTQQFSNETQFGIINAFNGTNHYNSAFWLMHPNRVNQFLYKNSVNTTVGTGINPFTPQSNREYFRIRASGTSLIFDTSPTGVDGTWTTRHTDAGSTLINKYVFIALEQKQDAWTMKEVYSNLRESVLVYRKQTETVEAFDFADIKDAINLTI